MHSDIVAARAQKFAEHCQKVKGLRQAGKTNEEIATELGLSASKLNKCIARLLKDGAVKNQRSKYAWEDLDDPRTQGVVAIIKSGGTDQEIAAFLGATSRECGRQTRETITVLHEAKVFEPDKKIYSTKEAAEWVECSEQRVKNFCKQGKVPHKLRGQAYLLHEEGIDALGDLLAPEEKRCDECRQLFLDDSPGRNAKTCSRATCKKKKHEKGRQRVLAKEPSENNLRGPALKVFLALRDWREVEGETWISRTEAMRISHLTGNNLLYYRLRRIIATRSSHEHIAQNGKPLVFYAKSQMEIIAQLQK